MRHSCSQSELIAPGGGVIFESGGATVLYTSDGAPVSGEIIPGSYFVNNYMVGAIKSGGVLDASSVAGDISWPAVLKDLTLTGKVNSILLGDNECTLINAAIEATNLNNGAQTGHSSHITISGHCRFKAPIFYNANTQMTIVIKAGAIVDFTGGQSGYFSTGLIGTPTTKGITVEADVTFIRPNGTSFTLSPGTYTMIKQDGTTT